MLMHVVWLDCPRCGRRFAVIAEVSDDPAPAYAPPSLYVRCPRCGWCDHPDDALAIARHLNRKPLPSGRVRVAKAALRQPVQRKPLYGLHEATPTWDEILTGVAKQPPLAFALCTAFASQDHASGPEPAR
jgi:uncharacterized C2H2 Zn-finger protein